METKRTMQIINGTKSWLFEKINKINKSLHQTSQERRDMIHTNQVRDEKGVITTDTNVIRRSIRTDFESFCSSKLENLKEIGQFIDKYDLPKLNQEDVNNLNRSIMNNEIKAIKKNLSSPRLSWFTDESTRLLKKSQH